MVLYIVRNLNQEIMQPQSRSKFPRGATCIHLAQSVHISPGVCLEVSGVPPRAHVAIRQDQLRGNGSIKRGSVRCMHSETDTHIRVHRTSGLCAGYDAISSLTAGLYGRLDDCFRYNPL